MKHNLLGQPQVFKNLIKFQVLYVGKLNVIQKNLHVKIQRGPARVDVLQFQEQMARRPFPIGKILGPPKPSDLCTKNAPRALPEQYMKQLSVYFEDGRAAVAQQLQAVRERTLVHAVPQRGTMPGEAIGG